MRFHCLTLEEERRQEERKGKEEREKERRRKERREKERDPPQKKKKNHPEIFPVTGFVVSQSPCKEKVAEIIFLLNSWHKKITTSQRDLMVTL